MITISPQAVLACVVMGVSITTAIWYSAMHIGRLTVRVERVELKVVDHETRMGSYDRRLSEDDRRRQGRREH